MDFQLDTLKNLSNKQKMIAISLFIAVTAGAFIWFVFIPKSDEIARIEKKISNLNEEINIHRVKVRRLEDLRRENRVLQSQLEEQKEQLP
ncbi:hypothetical protein JYT87_03375, partial [Nitrospira defluvii]|nr:hypothetical protein [Nitrospira defluvii]